MLPSLTNSETLTGGEMPVLVTINGIPYWQASGRTFPVVAGAEDPPADGQHGDDRPPASGGARSGTEDDGGDEFDKERALATIRKLRDEQKASKAQLKELELLKAKEKEREDAEKSEVERLREQIADLERKATDAEKRMVETSNRQAIERAAAKAGAADPEDVYALLKPSDFDLDDGGALKNADKLVEQLLKAKPYLAGKPAAQPVPGTPRSNGSQTREDQVKENEVKLIATRKYQPLG